ncbi:MAG: electron transfer flavoprotein subunit alpha/FixB family protein [Bacteroidia bacterium]|nr:electron transfer flavoprotein subunit alpha/FixB family protein [Bacteroidia bacterium]
MAILVFVETQDGKYKKAGLEAVSYAAQMNVGEVTALCIGEHEGADAVAKIGASALVALPDMGHFDAQKVSSAISQVASSLNVDTVVISNSYAGKDIAPQIAGQLNASLATNVVSLPNAEGEITRGVYSGKAFAQVKLNGAKKVLAITPNSFDIIDNNKAAALKEMDVTISEGRVVLKELKKVTGKIPLTEAEVVISGGRGLKGPENWGLVEDLADELNAATACSKPVSDMEWRPHSEHVGQTGITIKPNLYIAIGISGAIQHLAGVSSSKTIVVINKDPEAPFFKAADYGIVGDAFDVIPKLTEALRNN